MTNIEPLLLPPLLPVLLPLGGAALALIGSIWNLKKTSWFAALAGVAAGTVSMAGIAWGAFAGRTLPVMITLGAWTPATGIEITLDTAGMVLGPTLFVVALLIMVYALGERRYGPVFAAIYATALAGMGGVVLAGDLFNLFVFFEILSLCAVILIAYERRGPALYAALRYLVVASVSIVFYLVGLLFLYRVTGHLSLSGIVAALYEEHRVLGPDAQRIAALGIAFLMGAVATRVAIVPFHGWLPAAHGQAPTPVSALLSGLMLKSGFLALLRTGAIARIVAPGLFEILVILGGVSAMVGAFMAFVQTDVKRMLAFSSVSQMGFVVAALAAGTYEGALYHAVAHALFKSLLFLVVGLAIARRGTHDLEKLRIPAQEPGRRRGRVFECLLFIVAAATVAGVPGFSGFAGKELIGTALKEGGLYSLEQGYRASHLLSLASAGTIATFLKLGLLYVPLRSVPLSVEASRHKTSALQAVVVTVLAVLVALQGVLGWNTVTTGSLARFVPPLIAGSLMFLLSRLSWFKAILSGIAGIRFGMDGVLALVFTGMLLLAW